MIHLPLDIWTLIIMRLDRISLPNAFATCKAWSLLNTRKAFWYNKCQYDGGDRDYFRQDLSPKEAYLCAMTHAGTLCKGSEKYCSLYELAVYAATIHDTLLLKYVLIKFLRLPVIEVGRTFGFSQNKDIITTYVYEPRDWVVNTLLLEDYKEEATLLKTIWKHALDLLLSAELHHKISDPMLNIWKQELSYDEFSRPLKRISFYEINRKASHTLFTDLKKRTKEFYKGILQNLYIASDDEICSWLIMLHSSQKEFHMLLACRGFPADWDRLSYEGKTYHPFREKPFTDIVGFRKILAHVPLHIRLRDYDKVDSSLQEARYLVCTVPYMGDT